MKRILYLTLTIMLCLTFFTAVTWAEEKASAASDKILSQQQVDELLQADDNPAAYVKIDEDAYKVYPDFKDKKAVRKELLKNLPTNKVLYLLTASEQTFTLAFDVVKDLEKSGRLYDNSRYMGGKDDSDAGAENIKANIHKFWFMKIPRGSTVYDDGVNVGIGIGIGRRPAEQGFFILFFCSLGCFYDFIRNIDCFRLHIICYYFFCNVIFSLLNGSQRNYFIIIIQCHQFNALSITSKLGNAFDVNTDNDAGSSDHHNLLPRSNNLHSNHNAGLFIYFDIYYALTTTSLFAILADRSAFTKSLLSRSQYFTVFTGQH